MSTTVSLVGRTNVGKSSIFNKLAKSKSALVSEQEGLTRDIKTASIKKMTKAQALKDIDKLKKDLFNFRFQKINGQIKSPSKINETKKNIARLKTLIVRKDA